MRCLLIILVAMCLWLTAEVSGLRDIQRFDSYPNHKSFANMHGQTSKERLPIQTMDDLLNRMDESYFEINEAMKIMLETHGKTLDEVPVDCTSSRASELIAVKEHFDYCHNLTVQMKELKNLTEQSFNLLFDVGYAASIIVSSGIECHNHASPLSQLNCYMTLYRYTRNFLIENVPKIMKKAEEIKVMANIITVDSLNCFFHHDIDHEAAKEIALFTLKC
ncbi:uncharacterized protein LOC111057483 [Nilaparvata lugens]|uniref:uncharacterized protein LOC111057483 n=1 Tax=Nilaparvata lugens TaxID=108931 RepID=UPI00193E59BA|nr:uncharacterized protein LOC111057483 [Nilaparvata lugens]